MVDLNAGGGLVPGGAWSQPDLVSLHCDVATDRLQVLSFHEQTAAFQIVDYTMDATGDPSSGVTLTLDLPLPAPWNPSDHLDMTKAALLGHPVTGELWILSAYLGISPPDINTLIAWRLARDPAGTLAVVEGPTQIEDDGTLSGVAITDDGVRLVLGGYSGGCFGWIDLPGTGGLPAFGTVRYSCHEPAWGNGIGVAVGRGDEPFAQTYVNREGGTTLAKGRYGATGPELLDQTAVPGIRSRLLRVLGTDLVVTFGQDGQLATVDTADASLVVVDTVTIPGVEYGGSGVVVPCVP
jgi:hypothetical protein